MSDSTNQEGSTPDSRQGDDTPLIEEYDPPCVVDVGDVRKFTGGSSGSGRADANSQYYW
jgi:hypothetical protein